MRGWKVIPSQSRLRTLSWLHAEESMPESYCLRSGAPVKQTPPDLSNADCSAFHRFCVISR